MTPRITIIGGGSNQWVPKLIDDIAQMKTLQEAEIVLEDIDGSKLPRMQSYVEHVAKILGIPLTVRATTDQAAALDGADFVVVNISTGGFVSMRHDLEIPVRYGIHQSVGDTVGPGGIMRAVRNIPVFLSIAADMQERCPDAWLLNLTNPMTALCRAVTRETPVKTVGLCHEVTGASFTLSLLLDVPFFDIRPVIAGVNHLPVITALDAGGSDGLAALAAVIDGDGLDAPIAVDLPDDLLPEGFPSGAQLTRRALLEANKVKVELFRRAGALPAAGDRHLVEFFPGFLTEASEQGRRWGVHLTTIEERERDEARHVANLDQALASDEVDDMPSGEMVHAVIHCLMTGTPGHFPLNIPNAGQCPDLPADVVVESMCVADGAGIRGRDIASAPALLAEQLRRVSAAQELTVEAAVTGDPDALFQAMLADPLAGRIDFEQLARMTSEMIEATKPWLPQFA